MGEIKSISCSVFLLSCFLLVFFRASASDCIYSVRIISSNVVVFCCFLYYIDSSKLEVFIIFILSLIFPHHLIAIFLVVCFVM